MTAVTGSSTAMSKASPFGATFLEKNGYGYYFELLAPPSGNLPDDLMRFEQKKRLGRVFFHVSQEVFQSPGEFVTTFQYAGLTMQRMVLRDKFFLSSSSFK